MPNAREELARFNANMREWEDLIAELEAEIEAEELAENSVSNNVGWGHKTSQTAKSVQGIARPIGGMANSVAQATVASSHSVQFAQVAGVGLAVNPITTPVAAVLMTIDIGLSAWSAAKTYKHVKNLERILDRYSSTMSTDTMFALFYVLGKKNKKMKRKGIGCIPVLGSLANTVYAGGRSIYKRAKGTRGKNRRANAETLWGEHVRGDAAATAACEELLGPDTFGKIRHCHDGHLVLEKKLRSM